MPKSIKKHSKTDLALKIIRILKKKTKGMSEPMSQVLAKEYGHDPFIILISCLLSLRARDIQTLPVCYQLFKKARTPQQILDIPDKDLQKILFPLGFYRRKTQILKQVCKELIERFDGHVPDNMEDLLSIKGVGRKTANLVLTEAFNKPAICVDTHVHRLANLFGLVKTETAYQTEIELMKIIPRHYWREVNRLFVMWGQNTGRGKKSMIINDLGLE